MSIEIFKCTKEILDRTVDVKIYKVGVEDGLIDGYSFCLSHYFKSSSDMDVYRNPSCISETLEGCLFKLNMYINRFKDIAEVEENENF